MAAAHAGQLPFNCQVCRDEPRMREDWGCENPAPVAVWEEPELGEFFNCPLKFITEAVVDWYEEYAYCQEFAGAAPPFLRQSAKFVEAVQIYKTAFNGYMAKTAKKGNKPDGLQTLKERFDAGNRNKYRSSPIS